MDKENQSPLAKFCANEKAHTFNFVFASILFFGFGLPTVIEYGYSNNVYAEALAKQVTGDREDAGSLPSGRFGQGVFPMTLMLWVVAAFLYFSTLIRYCTAKPEDDEKEE
jgi:hypothetical protein